MTPEEIETLAALYNCAVLQWRPMRGVAHAQVSFLSRKSRVGTAPYPRHALTVEKLSQIFKQLNSYHER